MVTFRLGVFSLIVEAAFILLIILWVVLLLCALSVLVNFIWVVMFDFVVEVVACE